MQNARFCGENDNKMSNPERVGMPANYMLPQSSSSTLISQRSFDKQHIKRTVQYNRSVSDAIQRERSLYKTCCLISDRCKMHLVYHL